MLYPCRVSARLARLTSLFACLALGSVSGCDNGDSGSGGGSSSAGSGGSSTSTSGPLTTGTPGSSSDTGMAEGSSTEASDDSAMGGECVLWKADDCGEGRKCMPYSVEDDSIPDEIQCCDAVDNPALDGEPCEATDYNGSCLDNCAPGSMCVLDDNDTLQGLCRSFCDPTANDCDPDQTCKSFFELLPGVPNLPTCMDKCDPLLQNCSPQGWHCIPDTPTESGQSGFICTPPPPVPPQNVLGACALANQCEKGLVCVTDDRVPGCSFTSCCTAFCDITEGDEVCQDIDPNMVCVDWMSPDPDWENVGVCALPAQ